MLEGVPLHRSLYATGTKPVYHPLRVQVQSVPGKARAQKVCNAYWRILLVIGDSNAVFQ